MAPPHPRCCLNVGVTGHRLDRLNETTLEAGTPAIDALMRELVARTRILIAECPGVFADEPPEFRVMSGLAEGSETVTRPPPDSVAVIAPTRPRTRRRPTPLPKRGTREAP